MRRRDRRDRSDELRVRSARRVRQLRDDVTRIEAAHRVREDVDLARVAARLRLAFVDRLIDVLRELLRAIGDAPVRLHARRPDEMTVALERSFELVEAPAVRVRCIEAVREDDGVPRRTSRRLGADLREHVLAALDLVALGVVALRGARRRCANRRRREGQNRRQLPHGRRCRQGAHQTPSPRKPFAFSHRRCAETFRLLPPTLRPPTLISDRGLPTAAGPLPSMAQ